MILTYSSVHNLQDPFPLQWKGLKQTVLPKKKKPWVIQKLLKVRCNIDIEYYYVFCTLYPQLHILYVMFVCWKLLRSKVLKPKRLRSRVRMCPRCDHGLRVATYSAVLVQPLCEIDSVVVYHF